MPAGHVVVAPDKFKGSLTAPQVAAHVAAGLERFMPAVDVRLAPVADGGDGMLEAVAARGFSLEPVVVSGSDKATGRGCLRGANARLSSNWRRRLGCGGCRTVGWTPSAPRAVGPASCCALRWMRGVTRSSSGLAAARAPTAAPGCCRRSESGSSTSRDASSVRAAPCCGISMPSTSRSLIRGLPEPMSCWPATWTIHSLGPKGAAAVYGPQKGATAAEVAQLEAGLDRWARVLAQATGEDVSETPSAGAAGGVGFAALAVLDATPQPGIELILDLIEFDELVRGARLVITGEGSLDEQSLHGKAPVGVASAAARHGLPTIAIAGRCSLSSEQAQAGGLQAVYALTSLEPDSAICNRDAGRLLEEIVATVVAPEWLGGGAA